MDLIIGAIIAMVLIDTVERWTGKRPPRKRRAWHRPSQYIMTHQEWRE